MGIKFRCPNGHKLHVKSFLAGKRGVCPKCGVAVEIPGGSTDDEGGDIEYLPGDVPLGPSPAIGMQPAANLHGFPVPAMPRPAAGQPAAARPQPIPAARPIPIPAPAPLPIPTFVPPHPSPIANGGAPIHTVGNIPPAANPPGSFSGGTGNWDLANEIPAVPMGSGSPAVSSGPAPPGGPQLAGYLPAVKKRGKIDMGRNGTLLLVFVALVLVGLLAWGILSSGNRPRTTPTPTQTPTEPTPAENEKQSRVVFPLECLAKGNL